MMNACVIDIDTEINEIVAHLQPLEGYLDCEKAVIQNIKKHLDKGYDDEIIAACLEKISFALRERWNQVRIVQILSIAGTLLVLSIRSCECPIGGPGCIQ